MSDISDKGVFYSPFPTPSAPFVGISFWAGAPQSSRQGPGAPGSDCDVRRKQKPGLLAGGRRPSWPPSKHGKTLLSLDGGLSAGSTLGTSKVRAHPACAEDTAYLECEFCANGPSWGDFWGRAMGWGAQPFKRK